MRYEPSPSGYWVEPQEDLRFQASATSPPPSARPLSCLGDTRVSRRDHEDPTDGELVGQGPAGVAHQEETWGTSGQSALAHWPPGKVLAALSLAEPWQAPSVRVLALGPQSSQMQTYRVSLGILVWSQVRAEGRHVLL